MKLDWTKKNRVAKGNYKHKRLLNELRVRLEVDTRACPEISYVEKTALNRELPTPVTTWRVPVMDGEKVYEDGVSPDDVFRLIFNYEPKPHNFATFFPEADRATEPNDTDTAREVLPQDACVLLYLHARHSYRAFWVPGIPCADSHHKPGASEESDRVEQAI